MRTHHNRALRAGPNPYSLIRVIRSLGLTSGLKICLDVGDQASYPGSGQSFLDLSGNSHDFFLGATGSGAGDDPTFNGVAGRTSPAEYFSYDGSDTFKHDSANPAWVDNLHKDNAKLTVLAWVLCPAATLQYLFATGNLSSSVGVRFACFPGSLGWNVVVTNTSHNAIIGGSAFGVGPTAGAWACVGVSIDEGSSIFSFVNGGQHSPGTAVYDVPSAAAASFTAEIGGAGGAVFSGNGARLACLAVWEGVALNITQAGSFFTLMRSRFGV